MIVTSKHYLPIMLSIVPAAIALDTRSHAEYLNFFPPLRQLSLVVHLSVPPPEGRETHLDEMAGNLRNAPPPATIAPCFLVQIESPDRIQPFNFLISATSSLQSQV